MSQTRLRPRSRIVSKLTPQQVLEQISQNLKSGKSGLLGQVVQEHAFIRIPDNLQHYWSPELHVWAREEEEGTIVYGVVGPKPKIWTMFVFFYTGVLTSAFFGGSYGVIQLMLGMEAPFLWAIPLGLLGLALTFGAAKYGQKKGKDQMHELQSFLRESVPN